MKQFWVVLYFAMAMLGAHAQGLPDKPITLVVPGAAGTAADVVARKMGERLREKLGQPVVVVNRPGAGGMIAYDSVARQKPDGYTLAIVAGGFAIFPVVFKNVTVDPLRDLTPVAQLAFTPMVFVARPESPFTSLGEVAAAAKTGRRLTYGTSGSASTAHLVGESFKQAANVDVAYVGYSSSALLIPDIISGRVDIGILDSVSALTLVTAGRLKALAIASPARVPAFQGVPTAAEAGIHFTAVGWVGLFGPAKLPTEITDKLNAAAGEAMTTAEMRDLLAKTGSLPATPWVDAAQWKTRFEDYVRTWGKVARDAGMTAD